MLVRSLLIATLILCHPNIGGRTNGEIRELYNRFKL